MTLDYSIYLRDGAGRHTTVSVNGASIDELIKLGWAESDAREGVESDACERAIATGAIGADAYRVTRLDVI